MSSINTGKVIAGGLVAGLIINVADFLVQGMYLKPDWDAVMANLHQAPMAGSGIAVFVVLDFLIGIFGVFGYAAMRPRFGPGPKTAILTGLMLFFAIALVPTLFLYPLHVMSNKMMTVGVLECLVVYPLGMLVGCKLYAEESADVMAHA